MLQIDIMELWNTTVFGLRQDYKLTLHEWVAMQADAMPIKGPKVTVNFSIAVMTTLKENRPG